MHDNTRRPGNRSNGAPVDWAIRSGVLSGNGLLTTNGTSTLNAAITYSLARNWANNGTVETTHLNNCGLCHTTAPALQIVLEVFTRLVFHDHIHGSVGLKKIKHVDDVGMVQRRRGAGLLEKQLASTVEAVFGIFISGSHQSAPIPFRQLVGYVFLDNNAPIIIHLARTVDHAETATTQRFFQLISIQASAGF